MRDGRATKTKAISPAEGSLCVWHIPQIPGKPFYVTVKAFWRSCEETIHESE